MKAIYSIAIAASVFAAHGLASAAPEIKAGAEVNVTNNKAKNITTGGGSGSFKTLGGLGTSGGVSMNGTANVNSLVLNGGGKVAGKVNITGNEASDVKAVGGAANVNSVVLNK